MDTGLSGRSSMALTGHTVGTTITASSACETAGSAARYSGVQCAEGPAVALALLPEPPR